MNTNEQIHAALAGIMRSTTLLDMARAAQLDPASDFRRVDLSGADLRCQDLRPFDLRDANFYEAEIYGTTFNDTVTPHQLSKARRRASRIVVPLRAQIVADPFEIGGWLFDNLISQEVRHITDIYTNRRLTSFPTIPDSIFERLTFSDRVILLIDGLSDAATRHVYDCLSIFLLKSEISFISLVEDPRRFPRTQLLRDIVSCQSIYKNKSVFNLHFNELALFIQQIGRYQERYTISATEKAAVKGRAGRSDVFFIEAYSARDLANTFDENHARMRRTQGADLVRLYTSTDFNDDAMISSLIRNFGMDESTRIEIYYADADDRHNHNVLVVGPPSASIWNFISLT